MITGANFVRFTRHGLQLCRRTWPSVGDRFEIRRQALKLRFWDQRHLHPPGKLLDLTYESIKSLAGMGIYELRLDDSIGGQANLRVVFLDPPRSWLPLSEQQRPLPVVWVLEVLPKKRDEWTKNDIARFRAARTLIRTRLYQA